MLIDDALGGLSPGLVRCVFQPVQQVSGSYQGLEFQHPLSYEGNKK